MMLTSLHCNQDRMTADVYWERRFPNGDEGNREDYFTVRVSSDGGDVTLFLSPAQLESLAVKLVQAAQDRGVVLAEEAKASAVLELAGEG